MLRANLVSVFLQMQNSAAQELRTSAPQAFPQLGVGQALTATIVSRVADGLFLADIQGQRMQLALPANVVSGDTVSLRVLRASPDYVFELLPRAGTGPDAEHLPSTAISQGAQIIHLALGDARGLVPASLSTAAPLLASAPGAGAPALSPGSSALRPEAAATPSGVPALQGALTGGYSPAQQLAAVLRDTIANSGLFYESHLSDWVHGQRSLAELRREPQAEWSAARMPTAGAPEEAGPILRQQLEALETRQFAWQGPVWPGQQVTLTIAEDAASRGNGHDTASWRTTLDLSLPQLGAIHADLVAAGEWLTISIAAPDTGTARILRSGLPALDELLRTCGLRPQFITVADDA